MNEELNNLTAIIVDDSHDFTKVLTRLLEKKCGFKEIHSFTSIDDAKPFVKDLGKSAVYFVDYNFPTGEKGTDFLEFIHQNELLDNSVAFLVTSEPTLKNMESAKKSGAIGVVAKPLSIPELVKQLGMAVQELKMQSEEFF